MAIDTERRRKPQQARSRACVEALLTATAQILVEESYDKASTNKIARRAGVSIGSLYHYFPSKEALVAALIERRMAHQRDTLIKSLEAVRDAPIPAAARAVIEAMSKMGREDPGLQAVIIEQVPRVGKLGEAMAVERQLARLLRPVLEARRDELRVDDLELATYLVVHVVSSAMYASAIAYPDRVSSGAVADEMVDLVTRYLCVDDL